MHRTTAPALAGFIVAALHAAPTHADPRRFLSVSLNGGGYLEGPPLAGLGLEASYYHQGPDGAASIGYGAALHAQLLASQDNAVAGHVVAAGQLAWACFGVEIGAAARTPIAGYAFTMGLHVSPFLSFGFAHFELPIFIPAVVEHGATPPVQVGLIGGITLPITLNRTTWTDWFDFSMPHGRPLDIAGVSHVADDIPGDAWCPDDHGLADGAAPSWRRAAVEEHAAIASFARLSLQLLALAAPPSLVARALTAAIDEIQHAQRCFSFAHALDGAHASPGPLPAARAPIAPVDVAALARESLRAGCVGEGAAAQHLAREAQATTDPAARAALARMADDETRHAELAWDIVAWALTQNRSAVTRALAAEAATTRLPGEVAERLWREAFWNGRESLVRRDPPRCARAHDGVTRGV